MPKCWIVSSWSHLRPNTDNPPDIMFTLMGIEVTIADDSDNEMVLLRQLSILILALRGCLCRFPDEERERMIDALPWLVRDET